MFGGDSNSFWHPHSVAQGQHAQNMANATMGAFAQANQYAVQAAQNQRAQEAQMAQWQHEAEQANAQRQHELAMEQMRQRGAAARNRGLQQAAGLGGYTITGDGFGGIRNSLLD